MPAKRAEAAESLLGRRCPYRSIVVLMLACPSRLETTCIGTPSRSNKLACVSQVVNTDGPRAVEPQGGPPDLVPRTREHNSPSRPSAQLAKLDGLKHLSHVVADANLGLTPKAIRLSLSKIAKNRNHILCHCYGPNTALGLRWTKAKRTRTAGKNLTDRKSAFDQVQIIPGKTQHLRAPHPGIQSKIGRQPIGGALKTGEEFEGRLTRKNPGRRFTRNLRQTQILHRAIKKVTSRNSPTEKTRQIYIFRLNSIGLQAPRGHPLNDFLQNVPIHLPQRHPAAHGKKVEPEKSLHALHRGGVPRTVPDEVDSSRSG